MSEELTDELQARLRDTNRGQSREKTTAESSVKWSRSTRRTRSVQSARQSSDDDKSPRQSRKIKTLRDQKAKVDREREKFLEMKKKFQGELLQEAVSDISTAKRKSKK